MNKNGHIPQHKDGPTWCIRCGTFSHCFELPCVPRGGGFDASTKAGADQISTCMGFEDTADFVDRLSARVDPAGRRE